VKIPGQCQAAVTAIASAVSCLQHLVQGNNAIADEGDGMATGFERQSSSSASWCYLTGRGAFKHVDGTIGLALIKIWRTCLAEHSGSPLPLADFSILAPPLRRLTAPKLGM
jgi:hypothetical protein